MSIRTSAATITVTNLNDSGTVTMSLLTIADGYAGPGSAVGGGIFNEGTLWGFNLRVVSNTVEGNAVFDSFGDFHQTPVATAC